jgi:DNA-binding LytR/AlgR family response regulator
MRIAIVDNEPKDAARLKTYLERFGREQGLELEPICYASAQDFFQAYQFNFALVILDIDMPGMNGVEAARQLRKADSNVVLMFVTNMPQYALCGYEVEALDYVIKPVAYGEFSLKLKKALRYIRRNQDDRVTLHTQEGAVSLSVRDIYYVESALHYLTYHTTEREYRVRGSMGEAEQQLLPLQFARCHSSFLVNLRYVRAIEKDDVLVENARLKISRGRRQDFLNQFTRFLGGMQT